MNLREKLLLVWAVTATAFLVCGGVIFLQMLVPHFGSGTTLMGAPKIANGEPVLYECSREHAHCYPSNGTRTRFTDYASAVRAGAADEFAFIWVTHDSPTEWRAFSAISTHLGCFVFWNTALKRFEDPCGGARWNGDGSYQEGPAPRNLDSFPARVENGDVNIKFELIRGQQHN